MHPYRLLGYLQPVYDSEDVPRKAFPKGYCWVAHQSRLWQSKSHLVWQPRSIFRAILHYRSIAGSCHHRQKRLASRLSVWHSQDYQYPLLQRERMPSPLWNLHSTSPLHWWCRILHWSRYYDMFHPHTPPEAPFRSDLHDADQSALHCREPPGCH